MPSIFLVSSTIFGHLTYQDCSFRDPRKSYYQLSEIEPFYPNSMFTSIWIYTFSNIRTMRSCSYPMYAFVSVCVIPFTGKFILQYILAVIGVVSLNNNTPRRQAGLYSSQQCTKGFLGLSDEYVFLASRKAFRKRCLRKNLLRSFSPRGCPDQHRHLSNHCYYFPHYWYSTLCASLKNSIGTYMPSIILRKVLQIRLSGSSRLLRYSSIYVYNDNTCDSAKIQRTEITQKRQ